MKIIEKWKIWLLLSGIFLIPGIIALSIWGLKLGIDFSGGTLLEMQFIQEEKIEIQQVRDILDSKDIKGAQISFSGDNTFLVRMHLIDNEKYKELKEEFNNKIGESKELRFETVGPTISRDLTRKAFVALILASVMIILYIAWAFRSVPKPLSSWKFGVTAVLALIHDILFVVGVFALLGHYLGVEVDNLFITALLTILGFSVHDTIVVFDRIRENLKTTSGDLAFIANKSINETMARSINTTATVLFTLLALLLFGGQSIFWFVFALFIGVAIGTYSSIFVASVIMVLWHRKVKI
uniref:Protein-export membrane protein SecF n=1 Tax=candidate division CPR3 bacterium TaxID=2268181 RepID=A0A7C4R1Z9_UNCC3